MLCMQHCLDRFVLSFDEKVRHETFECSSYRGITFFVEGFRYEVIQSLLGVRLLVTSEDKSGYLRDLPFHEGTWRFLPEAVRVHAMPPSSTG